MEVFPQPPADLHSDFSHKLDIMFLAFSFDIGFDQEKIKKVICVNCQYKDDLLTRSHPQSEILIWNVWKFSKTPLWSIYPKIPDSLLSCESNSGNRSQCDRWTSRHPWHKLAKETSKTIFRNYKTIWPCLHWTYRADGDEEEEGCLHQGAPADCLAQEYWTTSNYNLKVNHAKKLGNIYAFSLPKVEKIQFFRSDRQESYCHH